MSIAGQHEEIESCPEPGQDTWKSRFFPVSDRRVSLRENNRTAEIRDCVRLFCDSKETLQLYRGGYDELFRNANDKPDIVTTPSYKSCDAFRNESPYLFFLKRSVTREFMLDKRKSWGTVSDSSDQNVSWFTEDSELSSEESTTVEGIRGSLPDDAIAGEKVFLRLPSGKNEDCFD
ncbi:hypothetical protein K0M31_008728 [Melipona bicolor]|uniref:Uncharacterized protein n=1 Tax=Melipona bicolor TaxID=60889 RepID=A0AA40FQI5_9HYME|nr:hypothetical protein K0M31_008728 [Melipona bicolor]